MTPVISCLIDVVLGIAVLAVANAILDPVPLLAVIAWAAGILMFCVTRSRSLRWTSIGFVAGALVGAAHHLFVHSTGRSTPPPEGIYIHLLDDAIVGALCAALALTASVGRHWRRLTGG